MWGRSAERKERDRERLFHKWQVVRARGKLRHLLTIGGGWALWMYLVLSLLPVLFHHRPPSELWIGAIKWSLAGWLFGTLMWSFSERAYLKELKRRGLRPVEESHFP